MLRPRNRQTVRERDPTLNKPSSASEGLVGLQEAFRSNTTTDEIIEDLRHDEKNLRSNIKSLLESTNTKEEAKQAIIDSLKSQGINVNQISVIYSEGENTSVSAKISFKSKTQEFEVDTKTTKYVH
jgi:hypothetical protein